MAILLDSHVVVWALLDEPTLSLNASKAIQTSDVVYVSAVSLYEIGYKRLRNLQRGILDALTELPEDLVPDLLALDFTLLDVTPHQARLAANLGIIHGDPWDRILIAQAVDLDLPLVSCDAALTLQAGETPILW